MHQLPPTAVLKNQGHDKGFGFMSNCGLDSKVCDSLYSVPVWVSTGSSFPELCINSHLVYHSLLQIGSQGLHLAQFNPANQIIVNTLSTHSSIGGAGTHLEIFFENVPDQDVVFGVFHGDTSKINLTFPEFGIKFGDTTGKKGFFVGQRGAKKAIQAVTNGDISFRGCVPRQIRGLRFSTTPIPESGMENRYCGIDGIGFDNTCMYPKQFGGKWLHLTGSDTMDDSLFLPLVTVLAGNDAFELAETMETLANQPHVRFIRLNITIYASELAAEFDGLKQVASQYGIRFITCNEDDCLSITDVRKVAYTRTISDAKFFKHQHFIFLEPGAKLAPDFLLFMARAYGSNLNGVDIVSGYNENDLTTSTLKFPSLFFSDEQTIESDEQIPICAMISVDFAERFNNENEWPKNAVVALPGRNLCITRRHKPGRGVKLEAAVRTDEIAPFSSIESYKERIKSVIGNITSLGNDLCNICENSLAEFQAYYSSEESLLFFFNQRYERDYTDALLKEWLGCCKINFQFLKSVAIFKVGSTNIYIVGKKSSLLNYSTTK